MNEEISVTIKNNTSQIQPINLFTEIFAIPINLSQDGFWDVSGESFYYNLYSPQIAQIQVDTSPIGIGTPYTSTANLSSLDADGVVIALNNLGVGTFINTNNLISYVGLSNLYYGNLRISPAVMLQVQSNTISGNPALQLVINGNPIIGLNSGINTGGFTFAASSGDSILINYQVGALSIGWSLVIDWYQPNGIVSNIFTNTGVGAIISNYSFLYPSVGNILVNLSINP